MTPGGRGRFWKQHLSLFSRLAASLPWRRWAQAICTGALLLPDAHATAAEPPGYYDSVAGLRGAALRNALHQIIDQHTVVSYSASRAALEALDQDPANSANVILLYERSSWPKSQFISSYPGGWNREHCWPNAHGIDNALPAYSDLYNLRACGEPSNSDRANLYYDESVAAEGAYQRPAGSTTPLCSQDVNSWEPPIEVKGDLARAMFYMDIRYEGDAGEPNLILTDNAAQISSSGTYMGRLSSLLIWHFLDPVSPAEKGRLEAAYGYQGNRNPFVDRPEWVEAVYGNVLRLNYAVDGDSLVLSWPAILPADMASIEASVDLVSWAPAQLTVVDRDGYHTASVPLGSGPAFYRLRLRERDG